MADQLKPNPEWLKNDLVRDQLAKASAWFLEEMDLTYGIEITSAVHEQPLGSPIEVVFLMWFAAYAISHESPVELTPQVEVLAGERKYRLDFSVVPKHVDVWFEATEAGYQFPQMGVELDGHDFHEKTKEQVTWRNQRDRDLQRAGWKIYHFSGSELVKDGERCVREVIADGTEAYWKMHHWIHRVQREQLNQLKAIPKSIEPSDGK